MSEEVSTIAQWFTGQHVLVTGATGFLGKILIEKLLRSCPEISTIYLVIRPKRGKTSQQRIDDFVNNCVFDLIRDSPNGLAVFKKLHCVSGDITQPNLGLSAEDIELLEKNVTTFFHMAANVRFDQPLKEATILNTGGTIHALDLALNFGKLKAFVHVSTSYCQCDEVELFEKTYKAPHNPRKILEMVNWMDDDLLELVTPKLLGHAPNTYSYTKCLTEDLVTEYADKLPIAITRPSIVAAVWKEPIPGWIDNLNGPTGIMVGAGKGVIRSMHCDASLHADVVPVDTCANAFIKVAWKLGTEPKSSQPLVVNVTYDNDKEFVTWGQALEMGKKFFYENPFSVCLWYPAGSIKSNYLLHMICVFFFHTIPAYVVDFLMVMLRRKPFLVRTQKRISTGLKVLQYYTTRPWKFHHEKLREIDNTLSEKDKEIFYTSLETSNWTDYLFKYLMGARKYCVHEEPSTLPHARKVLKRLYYLDVLKNVVLYVFLLWFMYEFCMMVLQKVDEVYLKIH